MSATRPLHPEDRGSFLTKLADAGSRAWTGPSVYQLYAHTASLIGAIDPSPAKLLTE
jgi:hypothetical protein